MLSGLFKLGFLSFIANVLTKSGVFIVSMVLSHVLTIEDYATYSLLYNLTMVLGTLSAASFGILITNKVSQLNISTLVLLKNRLPISIFLSFLCALSVYFFVDLKGVEPVALFLFVFVCSVTYSIESMLSGGLNAKLLYKKILINGLLKTLVLFIFSFILTWTFGFVGSVLALALYVFFGAIFNYIPFVNEKNTNKWFSENKYILFKEALPLILTNVMVTGFIWCLNYYAYESLGTQESGLLSVLLQISQMILFISTALSAPLLPFLNKFDNKKVELSNLYIPTILVGSISLIAYKAGIFQLAYGNGIINSSNVDLLADILMITIISIFKLSLFRKNIQAGKLHLSLINNALWLSLVFVGILCFGFELEVLIRAMLFSHIVTVFTSLYMYNLNDVIKVKLFFDFYGFLFIVYIAFCWWILM
ncbi:TPA: oligosaccharide flippase family protein [Vibrio vulnificus]|nr:oligosaccharide flippase family protein [Vibrio vulnificus]